MSMISIKINGERARTAPQSTLADILLARKIDAQSTRGVAVALNDAFVRRNDWGNRVIGEGDQIEIVTAQQGG